MPDLDHKAKAGQRLLYGLDELPPAGPTVLYALQWLIIFLPMLTMVSLLATKVLELDQAAGTLFFQRLLMVTGLTMIVQTLWGHRLPLLDGPAMALIITLAALATSGRETINGGMIFGGLLIVVFSNFGLVRFVTPLFTDRVVGVILLLIGLSALPFLMPMLLGLDQLHPQGQWQVMVLGILTLVLIVLFANYLKGLLGSLSIFLGIAVGTLAFSMFGLADWSGLDSTPWLLAPKSFMVSMPRFTLSSCLSFSLAYLAVMVNAMGSVYSLEPILKPKNLDNKFQKSLLFTGFSGILAGLAGVVGTVPYSNSPGIILVTRVGTRYAVSICGVFVLLLAFCGKINAAFAAVPQAVVAGALLAAIAAQIGVSIEILNKSGPMESRDYLVVGLPTVLGMAANLIPKEFLNQLPGFVGGILGNGLVVGVMVVLLMEHLVAPDKRGR
jgi:uracil permease